MATKKPAPSKYQKKEKVAEMPPFSTKGWKFKNETPKTLVVEKQYRRETAFIPSLSTPGGSTALKDSNKYTGDNLKGISLVHKSGFAPVFTDEQAKEFASMRR